MVPNDYVCRMQIVKREGKETNRGRQDRRLGQWLVWWDDNLISSCGIYKYWLVVGENIARCRHEKSGAQRVPKDNFLATAFWSMDINTPPEGFVQEEDNLTLIQFQVRISGSSCLDTTKETKCVPL